MKATSDVAKFDGEKSNKRENETCEKPSKLICNQTN